MTESKLTLFTTSSLEKIFADEYFFSPAVEYHHATMLTGERFSFQIAYCLESKKIMESSITLTGSLADHVFVRQVESSPSRLPAYPDGDQFVLRREPGLYPDMLLPFSGKLRLLPGQWHSLWVTVLPECTLKAGTYDLTFTFSGEDGSLLGDCTFTLERLSSVLPEQTLIHTEWFHSDCIADYYNTPVFSEKYWLLTERYMKAAAEYGVNMLLTPLFTPPLDTAPGGERTTVQLIDVFSTDAGYEFSFEKLDRWISLCQSCNIKYLEFSHFFTQWGAGHAPKIMAAGKTGPVKLFGWDTSSDDPAYKDFLKCFLPRLMEFIESHNLRDRCFFHVSDEPHKEHLPAYLAAKNLLSGLIRGLPIMDAISDFEFYQQGIVDVPVCSTDHLEPFLNHGVENLWVYYCSGQYKDVANRFFCMPSLRNRILGLQLYRYKICGFLHWGFNFWNAAFSVRPVNPFCDTDAGIYFPSGDSFLVYPGEDGPIGSIRGEVLMEGLQDMRAMQLLESLAGEEIVKGLFDEETDRPFSFTQYPHEDEWLLSLREKCNEWIKKLS